MKKTMLIIAISMLLMFSGSVFAFCVYNNLDSRIWVSCDDPFRELDMQCEGIEVSPNSHVCLKYQSSGSDVVIVTAFAPDENFTCTRRIRKIGGTMQLYNEKFLWIFNVSINCKVV